MRAIWNQTSFSLGPALLLPCLIFGQVAQKQEALPPADKKLTFDVASVKPNKTDGIVRGNFPGLAVRNTTRLVDSSRRPTSNSPCTFMLPITSTGIR